MKKTDRYITSTSIALLIIVSYFFVSVIYYGDIWRQIFSSSQSGVIEVQGESHVYEFIAETVRENILHNETIYYAEDVLYPHGWNFALDDVAPINGAYFLLLRPFLSIHQAFMLITILNVIFSCTCMYMFLRLIGNKRDVAYLGSIVFGFTPFVSYRIWGHPTYVAGYLFVLPAIGLICLYKAKSFTDFVLGTILLVFSWILLLLTNLYFAVMGVVMVFALINGYLLLKTVRFVGKRKVLPSTRNNYFNVLLNNRKRYRNIVMSILLSFTVACLFLAPWIIQGVQSLNLNGYPPPLAASDSIPLSADVIQAFWPARNPFYLHPMTAFQELTNFYPWVESFSYPGAILLFTVVAWFIVRHRIADTYTVLLLAALQMYTLTLGPNLKILNNITSIPMPFILMSKVPFFQMARAPGRFIIVVVFLLTIIFAGVLTEIYRKNVRDKFRWRVMIFFFLLSLILVDQTVAVVRKAENFAYPEKTFECLNKLKIDGPLLEIPLFIRDGTKNHGSLNSVWMMRAKLHYDMPVVSVYAGRVPQMIFDSMRVDPLLGPLGDIVNTQTALIEKQKILSRVDFAEARASLRNVGFQSALIKTDEDYVEVVEIMLKRLGFSKVASEDNYELWVLNEHSAIRYNCPTIYEGR